VKLLLDENIAFRALSQLRESFSNFCELPTLGEYPECLLQLRMRRSSTQGVVVLRELVLN
jgi:hypothetical protein